MTEMGNQLRRRMEGEEYERLLPTMRDQIKSMPWYQGPAYLLYAGYAGTNPSPLRERIVWFVIGTLYVIPFLAILGVANLIARGLF